MSNESVLEYIKQYLTEMEAEFDEATEPSDRLWYAGARRALEHILEEYEVEY